MTAMCTAAANYIINVVNTYNEGKPLRSQIIMSSKRLQKILYFSEVLYMDEHGGTPMLQDNFYAWPSGPVIPSVYRKFMQYQDGEMRPYSGKTHDQLDTDMEKVLKRVIAATKTIDTSKLVEKSHAEDGPWFTVYDESDENYSHIVEKDAVNKYYAKTGVPYGKNLTVEDADALLAM